MDSNEQDREIARMWRQKRDLERELACLESKRDSYWGQLVETVDLLNPDTEPPVLPGPQQIEIPTAEEIRVLLNDIERVKTRLADVNSRLDRC